MVVLSIATLLTAQEKAIDVQRSTITVHVGKAGLFSVAGHDHWVEAPISSGLVKESASASVVFRVQTASMRVKPDPRVDAKTQSEIQKDMEARVLESTTYPEILFRSSRVVKQGEGQWRVEGALTLHGATKPVTSTVTRSGDAYAGRITIRQTDFGIKPITAVGGTVKVKVELEIEFRIFARSE